jgi:hypothetical protein
MLKQWLAEAAMESRIRLTFYLPPHIYNVISFDAGVRLLRRSDALCNKIPYVRSFAGIIIAEGTKQA